MSLEHGLQALNLDAPPRVPRTEYSADTYHWELMSVVTGIAVDASSSDELKARARREFRKAWNYDFLWSTLVDEEHLGSRRTDMGHAAYAADASDRRDPGPPAFAGPEDVLAFDPAGELPQVNHAAWVQAFNRHYAERVEAYPDAVNMTGVYVTLVSGLLALFGWDNLLTAVGLDDRRFGEITDSYARWMAPVCDALADSDAAVVMMHDDIVWSSGPFLHPDWYRRYVFPAYRRYLEPLREAGKTVAFTSDGDYTGFVEDLVGVGVDGFVMEPMTDMAYVADRYGRSHFFIGNADTRVLLAGSPSDIDAEVDRCLSIGKDCPGYFLAVGNHIPPNTPVESAIAYNRAYEKRMWR